MRQDVKEIRTMQIACSFLLRNIPNLKLEQVFSNYYDVVATEMETGIRFGIYITSSFFSRSENYARYLNNLKSINLENENNRLPIIIVAVNEKAETAMFGVQFGWKRGKAIIYTKPSMRKISSENTAILMDIIKSMDETIRVLSEESIKVVKKIHLEKRTGLLVHRAEIVYLRDFTQEYKMYQKEVVDERERFERSTYGRPQIKYPEDFLDEIIYNAVLKEYPDARKSNSLLLFSTNLGELQEYSRYTKLTSYIRVKPDIDVLPQELLPILEGVKLLCISQDLFVNFPPDVDNFKNSNFEIAIPFKTWLNSYIELKSKLTSIHSPTEFFIN